MNATLERYAQSLEDLENSLEDLRIAAEHLRTAAAAAKPYSRIGDRLMIAFELSRCRIILISGARMVAVGKAILRRCNAGGST